MSDAHKVESPLPTSLPKASPALDFTSAERTAIRRLGVAWEEETRIVMREDTSTSAPVVLHPERAIAPVVPAPVAPPRLVFPASAGILLLLLAAVLGALLGWWATPLVYDWLA
ncbi:MAG: hypothetical protein KC731_25975 [Myxococcales bacterium]|nr:hypothetical protein [Myxococcales bacterium]